MTTDADILTGPHVIDPTRFNTHPTTTGPRLTNHEPDNEAPIVRRCCLATRDRPGDMFPPTCKQPPGHRGPHQAACSDEWSE